MRHLSTFLPAETLLVLEGSNASLKELLKLTFMDLLIKEIIEVSNVTREPYTSRDMARTYQYIIRGKNFSKHKPAEHEMVFLSPYYKSSSIKVLLHHLARMGFQNAKSESKYISLVSNSQKIKNHFSKNIFQSVFGGFSITSVGIETQTKIKEEIAKLEKELPPIIAANKDKAKEILNIIGGNLFLLKGIDYALLQQIDMAILAEINSKKYKDKDGGSGGGCSGYGCSYWDAGCTGGGHSGCSGTGCSGCGGGCGGCGGCS